MKKVFELIQTVEDQLAREDEDINENDDGNEDAQENDNDDEDGPS